jgi:hypothetical protein
MKEVTVESIQNAYSRFKAYVYYDNFNLSLRSQLSEYEKDDDLVVKLTRLAKELNKYLFSGKLSSRLSRMINENEYIVLPKYFSNSGGSQKKNSILISNQHFEEFRVESTTKLFHGHIELHLIATLWIIEEGVKLHKKIGDDSYGYHLPVRTEENELGAKKLLFTKYFDKYQEWRDKGIKAAKNQIDLGNDVLLISLDIKNFFHSSHVDFILLKKDLKINNDFTLTDIIEKICVVHTKKLLIPDRDKTKPLLPIGLVSSGVIANWLLSDFDKELKDRTAPVYYGRYVDDIFIVISNVKPPQEELSEDGQGGSIPAKTVEWLANRFFPNKTPLFAGEKSENLKFSDHKKCQGLEIQTTKLKLFYFSPEWPHAMLNKFQKTLEENSSAFWFLPDEEEMIESLDDKAYDMQYEDTINKFRSVADVKASKYGASVFLAKRIKLAILHSGSPDDKITNEVFRFFRGVSILSLYNMWEKVFSYLVVTNDVKAIRKLHRDIVKALLQVKSEDNQEKLIQALTKHLDVCLQMAFSLNPSLLDWLVRGDEGFGVKADVIKNGIQNLRYSLLTRHHYLPLPALIITEYYTNTMEGLLSEGLLDKLLDEDSKLKKNEKLLSENWRIPRWYYLQEVCMYFFLCELKEWKSNSRSMLFRKNEGKDGRVVYSDSYIENCIDLFEVLNNKSLSKLIEVGKFKTYRDNRPIPKIDSDVITIKSGKRGAGLKLGLSNMRLDEKDLRAAIAKKSIINSEKRKQHIKHLNLAEQEKVDLLILPETTVPLEWLFAYADEARRKSRAFIFGLEHFTIRNFCFNFSIALLPLDVGSMNEVFILPRLKNHYSPKEEIEIKKIGKDVPVLPMSFYYLIKWRGIHFTIYNCYELADVVHRSMFRSEVDILFAIEYNKDTNYFSNIAEATCRDLHCVFVQANTSEYGDSRVVEPRETRQMNPIRVKGGENNVILRYEIDIRALRAFQTQRLPYQLNNTAYKTTPPDFDHKKVDERNI